MAESYCPDCKKSTEVVFDHAASDTVCFECGFVLEAHSVDETSEWKTFANKTGDNDPVRVSSPSNPLLTDGGLSTVTSTTSRSKPITAMSLEAGIGIMGTKLDMMTYFYEKKADEAEMRHLQKIGAIPMCHLQELRLLSIDGFEPNQRLMIEDIFKEGGLVDVVGNTIGKGFQGGIK